LQEYLLGVQFRNAFSTPKCVVKAGVYKNTFCGWLIRAVGSGEGPNSALRPSIGCQGGLTGLAWKGAAVQSTQHLQTHREFDQGGCHDRD
ncbi:MAG: hypothetical protein L7W43_16935, partial [Rubripirellula sp.]|nr:hypothetical protein [Rubripirellula sp.]